MRLTSLRYRHFTVISLGKLSYSKGLELQKKYVELVKKYVQLKAAPTLTMLFEYSIDPERRELKTAVEHTPVYTVGIRSKLYSVEEEMRLKALGADFHRTSRGGLVTFHGPGQLVIYPIFDLKKVAPRPVGVRRYVEMLEQVVIDCASNDFGIQNVIRTEHTGVWVGEDRKLAALGIAVSHGISYHGLALNCNTDLAWFDHVVACGIEGKEVTSLSRECQRDVSIEEVLPKMVIQFANVFSCDVK